MSEKRGIYQINPKTNEVINWYYCAASAQEELGIDFHNINACCRGKRQTAGGFRWEYDNEPIRYQPDPLQKLMRENTKAVVCYDRNTGAYIEQYNSVQEAAKAVTDKCYSDSISKCCKGKLNTAFGYIWRYLGDPAPTPPQEEVKTARINVSSKEVVQYDPKTTVPIKVYPSVIYASTHIPRTSVRSIVKVILKEQQTAGKYKFMFRDEYEKQFNHTITEDIVAHFPDFSGGKCVNSL